jgi:hypothetical protein
LKAVDARKVHDAVKEAVVDSLLNGLTARLSGSGEFGRVVYATKPRTAFTTAFLLPKPVRERVGDEEASPIQISAHGLDFQIASDVKNSSLVATATGSAYMRIYPTAEEVRPGAVCHPTFPITSAVKRQLKAQIRVRLADVVMELGGGDRTKARQHPDWTSRSIEARRVAHADVGLPYGEDVEDRVADDTESPVVGDSTDVPADPQADPAEDGPEGASDPTV